jgi:hypothetical protein
MCCPVSSRSVPGSCHSHHMKSSIKQNKVGSTKLLLSVFDLWHKKANLTVQQRHEEGY